MKKAFTGIGFLTVMMHIIMSQSLVAQLQINRLYGTNTTESGRSGFVLADSSIYALGTTSAQPGMSSQIYLVKTDKAGDLVWTKFFGSTGVDDGADMVYDGDTSIFVLSNSFTGTTKGYEIKIIRLNLDGEIIWEKNFGTTSWDVPDAIIQRANGDLVVSGYTFGGLGGMADAMLFSCTQNGDSLWFKTFGNSYDNYLYDIVEKNTDTITVCGESFNAAGFSEAWLHEINTTSLSGIDYFFNGPYNHEFNAIEILPNGNYYLGGTTDSFTVNLRDMFIVQLHKDSKSIVNKAHLPAANEEQLTDVKFVNNELIILGNTTSFGLGLWDAAYFRFDLGMNFLASNTFGTNKNEYSNSILLNNNGTIGFIGKGEYTFGANDLWIVNMDSNYAVYPVLDSEFDINSVNEHEENRSRTEVYPNPFTDHITINANLSFESYRIMDLSGKNILLGRFTNEISAGFLQSGTYLLELIQENGATERFKIVRF